MKTLRIILLGLTMSLTGCVSLTSVSTTGIPAERGQRVEASESRFLFLFLNFSNAYVDRLTPELARQCPKGRVEGILTKQEFVTYFPLFAHLVRVTATGYCVKGKAP